MNEDKKSRYKKVILVLLFILVFILGFVLGCFYCSLGSTGDVVLTIEDSDGDAAPDGTSVNLKNGDTKNVTNGTVTFTLADGNYKIANVSGESGINENKTFNNDVSKTDKYTVVVGSADYSSGGGSGGPLKLSE